MKTVFVLCGDYWPHGLRPLKVFESKEEAEAVKVKAIEHESIMPQAPLSSEREEWNMYAKAITKWEQDHPIEAGFDGDCGYVIEEIPIVIGGSNDG